MVGRYITRFAAGIAFFLALGAIVLAFMSEHRYDKATHKNAQLQRQLDSQLQLLDALVAGYEAQGKLNDQMVNSQRHLSALVKRLLGAPTPTDARSLSSYP